MSRPRGATIPPVPDNDSLQDRYAPANRCFGCGPANEKGLRIKSRVVDGELVAQWTPEPHHEAYTGMLNGGIIGTLLDCHGNWAAAYYLMTRDRLDTPPCRSPRSSTSSCGGRRHPPAPSPCAPASWTPPRTGPRWRPRWSRAARSP